MQSQPSNHSLGDQGVRTEPTFPHIVSKDLSGARIELPGGLPAERTILLIAFQREQQHDVDGWVSGLHLENGKLAWLEVPVIDNPGAIARWFIDNGMRRGIPNRETWKHVVTLYTGKAAFNAALGLKSESTVYAMVVDRQGKVLEMTSGPFTPRGADALLGAIAR